ncbi:MAG: DUF1329 domain-containing protein, partial [Thermodesulfobacteriota bacterium]|nr:DUF1329 domain-containing protein [Thermodesulfobacteriota bacterium]
GRIMVPPIPEVPGNNGKIRLKECFTIHDPYDVKGFAMIRARYEAIDKPDDVFDYLPALRRIRRMTGSDCLDPILGSDLPYDDFELCRQKITSKMTFALQQKNMLVPAHFVSKKEKINCDDILPHLKKNCIQWDWEIRPVNIAEILENDKAYPVLKRVIYQERSRMTAVGYATELYDLRGRLYRGQSMIINSMMVGPTWANVGWLVGRADTYMSGHSTFITHEFTHADRKVKPETFSFRYILREAK